MKRIWTINGEKPTNLVEFETRQVQSDYEPGGMNTISAVIPKSWSTLAAEILVRKYFKKMNDCEYETDLRQVVSRLAKTWSFWGWELGYFNDEDSRVFEDEVTYSLIAQIAAPNSPQWFNTGLYHAYGIEGEPLGHWYIDQEGQPQESTNAYERPQAHACFIQSVKSDLIREDGIFDLLTKEARLFKHGSGTGTNFSNIPAKGEALGGGGFASGLMGFLKVGDACAASVRSGGVTRRAAKMVILDIDHLDIISFINWKLFEERKVAALIMGSKKLSDANNSQRYSSIPIQVFDGDFNGEAYASVSGQNSNNSVRVPDIFMLALKKDKNWELKSRLNQNETKTLKASKIWEQLCQAAWECADPGIQFSDSINFFHTCKSDGEIVASNPCSEYFFLDDTGCNLASINLLKFYHDEENTFDIQKFVHTIEIYTTILDISVEMAQYPSKAIAIRSLQYRTLGLGFANLGALLMVNGIAYNSDLGRAVAATLSSFLTACAYERSIELAKKLGPYQGFKNNKKHHLKVLEHHAKLSSGQDITNGEVVFQGIKADRLPGQFVELYQACNRSWERVIENAKKYGLRNAQVTVIAPTGTIGLLMDCDTTGIEPEYALIKNKKMVGGDSKRIINQSFVRALKNLKYCEEKIEIIKQEVLRSGDITKSTSLEPDHYDVFQTALGKNSISPQGHLLMVLLVQDLFLGE